MIMQASFVGATVLNLISLETFESYLFIYFLSKESWFPLIISNLLSYTLLVARQKKNRGCWKVKDTLFSSNGFDLTLI